MHLENDAVWHFFDVIVEQVIVPEVLTKIWPVYEVQAVQIVVLVQLEQ